MFLSLQDSKTRKDKGKTKGHRRRSARALQSQRKKALESILANATPDAPCIFGEKVGKYRSSPDAAAAEMGTNKALKDFQKITDSKKEAAKMQMRQRRRQNRHMTSQPWPQVRFFPRHIGTV